MTLRDISTAQKFARACFDCFDDWSNTQKEETLEAFTHKWAEEHIPKGWRWPFYLVASSQYAETDFWIKETI